jgi:hypothetical protein
MIQKQKIIYQRIICFKKLMDLPKVVGVFRKLQQPSVSPVASHLKQALLGFAELNIYLYIT